MTGLRKIARRKLLSSISPVVPQQNIAALKTPEDQQDQWDTQRVVDLAARSGSFRSTEVARDGYPAHRSFPSDGSGQFIRLISTGVGSYIKVDHDLGRAPQGIIWIKQPTGPSYLVMEASTASSGYATNSKVAVVIMAGLTDELAIGIIF